MNKNAIPKKKIELLALALILSVVAQAFVLNAKANPYIHHYMGAPLYVEPPNITIVSPHLNEVFLTNENITFCCNVTTQHYDEFDYGVMVYFKGDWMINATGAENSQGFWVLSVNTGGISLGSHNLTITASGYGSYNVIKGIDKYEYNISLNRTSSTQFVIDKRPTVNFLSLKNEAFKSSIVPLNFTVDQPVSSIAYSLDGTANQTISGNTTLTGLSNGLHNVTVYANDTYGIMGASETVNFTVANPAPFPFVAAFSGTVSVVVIGAGLLVYFKKGGRDRSK